MGIKFDCPHCHDRLNVKAFLAGKRGVCPHCGGKILIPDEVTEDAEQPGVNSAERAEVAISTVSEAKTTLNKSASHIAVAQPVVKHAPAPSHHATEDRPRAARPAKGSAATDPFAEAPDAVWYVRPASGGEQYGPAKADVMAHWVAEGRVGPDALVWREGWAEWRVAADVFDSLPEDTSAPVTTVPPPSEPAPVQVRPEPAPVQVRRPASSPSLTLRPQRRKRDTKALWLTAIIGLGILAIGLFVTLVIILQRK